MYQRGPLYHCSRGVASVDAFAKLEELRFEHVRGNLWALAWFRVGGTKEIIVDRRGNGILDGICQVFQIAMTWHVLLWIVSYEI